MDSGRFQKGEAKKGAVWSKNDPPPEERIVHLGSGPEQIFLSEATPVPISYLQ